jgi:hypothetical protein
LYKTFNFFKDDLNQYFKNENINYSCDDKKSWQIFFQRIIEDNNSRLYSSMKIIIDEGQFLNYIEKLELHESLKDLPEKKEIIKRKKI